MILLVLSLLQSLPAGAVPGSRHAIVIVSPQGVAVATEEDLVCAEIKKDGLRRDFLSVAFNKQAQSRIHAMTTQNIGKEVELRICGKSHAKPKIMAPITGEWVSFPRVTATQLKCLKRQLGRLVRDNCSQGLGSVSPEPPELKE